MSKEESSKHKQNVTVLPPSKRWLLTPNFDINQGGSGGDHSRTGGVGCLNGAKGKGKLETKVEPEG